MFERTDPKTLKKWLIVAVVVYFLFPFDLIPDFLGIPGRIDDVVAMALLAWFYRSHVQQYVAAGFAREEVDRSPTEGSKAFDAYEVLGVTRLASGDAIKAAYRARMKEYHPDKVAHLGEELQKLALEKSHEIQHAYRQLRGAR